MIYRGSMELFLVTPLRDAECVFPIDDHLLKSVNTRLKIESVLLCATGNRRTIDAFSISFFSSARRRYLRLQVSSSHARFAKSFVRKGWLRL